MKLSKHFTLEELSVSQYAVRHDINNTPPPEAVASLRGLVDAVLQPLRDVLNRPVIVTSGYRCEELNMGINGSPTSQHMLGQAADIVVPELGTFEVVRTVLELGLPFDQLIEEFGRWVHVSHCGIRRGEVLRAMRKNGRTVYSPI
jgi:uncharacterized protein YcbK (DUF882 family)